MGKYLKTEKANICREEIYMQTERYIVQHGKIESNSGQLKFLQNLLIRNLAVSSRVRVRKEGFQKYVKNTLRACHNDEVIAFLDCEKNMEAFLQSSYCEEFCYYKLFKPEYGFPPYLLLQKTQERMEKAMLRYLKLPSGLEACDEKKGAEMERKKLEAYVEWLYSVALYEIFLKNCFEDINQIFLRESENKGEDKEGRNLMQQFQALRDCRDLDKQKEMAKEMADFTTAYMDKAWQKVFLLYYLNYFIQHQTNLYAMMRIIVLIEYVNINLGREEGSIRKKEDVEALGNAEYWKNMVQEWIEEGELFSETGRNRNMNVLYTELNKVLQGCEIFPGRSQMDIKGRFLEKAQDAISDLKQYIGSLQDYTVDKRPAEAEKKLWKIEGNLSAPIWNAVREISEITANAEMARKRNRN